MRHCLPPLYDIVVSSDWVFRQVARWFENHHSNSRYSWFALVRPRGRNVASRPSLGCRFHSAVIPVRTVTFDTPAYCLEFLFARRFVYPFDPVRKPCNRPSGQDSWIGLWLGQPVEQRSPRQSSARSTFCRLQHKVPVIVHPLLSKDAAWVAI